MSKRDEQQAIETANKDLTRAHTLRAQGKTADAEAILRDVLGREGLVEASRQFAGGHLAHLLLREGRADEANALFVETGDKATHYLAAAKLWGQAFLQYSKPERALELAERIIAKFPDDAGGYDLKGNALRAMERLDEAAEALDEARKRDPDNSFILNALVIVLTRLNRLDESRSFGQLALMLKDRQARTKFAVSQHKALTLNQAAAVKPLDPVKRERNIIAFALWGAKPAYIYGAIINAKIARYIYPEWTCRFYCDATVPPAAIEELKRRHAQVVMMDPPNFRFSGTFWRFLPSDDVANVDRFIVRDVDSRLNVRERVAVEEWVDSGKPFHIMRDNVMHNELILAGMWGGVPGFLPPLKTMFEGNYARMDHAHADQFFLKDVVWPLVREHALTHDSNYRVAGSKDFPEFGTVPPYWHVGCGFHDPYYWEGVEVPGLETEDYKDLGKR